ncbi:MAG: phosphoenolpyruvate synthase [Chloroflexi bacterium]|nr:phosphoenolpyruvate synthase [Chloroflexota bacterium]
MSMFVRRLGVIGAADLASVGGKAANLGELVRANFPVPDGFVLTTRAYDAAAHAALVDPTNSARAAARLREAPVPDDAARSVLDAYAALGGGPVAVRSSATAEDLPGASFAGQQDTYLNVVGDDALLKAIRRCWASLWNERAVAYRAAHGIDDRHVSLAVVVQEMVSASAAGVIFTADPLTGRRRRAVLDAVADLGDKLVSGAVNPDHYVVETPDRRIVERRLSGDARVLSDAELLELAVLAERVEHHFGSPQDIEFALDASRRPWLTQSRPITTLYPLPAEPPDLERDLRVYFSANVFQGYFSPITPMGVQFFRLLGSSVYGRFGASVRDTHAGPEELVEAGMRLYVDVTPVVRDRVGRQIFQTVTKAGEARTSAVVSRLADDSRFAPKHRSRISTLRRIAAAIQRAGIPAAALRVMLSPSAVRARYVREMESIARIDLPAGADSAERLDAFERLLLVASSQLLPRLLGIMAPAMLTLGLVAWLLRGRARDDELQVLTRSAPHNPTTEMDLALWSLSVALRNDTDSRACLLERAPEELSAAYQAAALPPRLQAGLGQFLADYGFRTIGEIDIGVPRWSEEPAHILGILSNYLRLADDAPTPAAQFARGQRDAETMVASLLARARGPRHLVLRVALLRLRQLIGSREAPKFHIIRLLATPSRELLKPVGVELAVHCRIASADDIFFLTLDEARRAVAGADFRTVVAARRREFERERTRRTVPRVLLSDGTDAEAAVIAPAAGALRGTPASPGTVTGPARVIHAPQGAHVDAGEILVAPSTDPGWTPLFLTAGGLVMEMGGMMSHGAVVAREYGIPAVVGLAGATERIATGQRITVDGAAGTVVIVAADGA